MVVGTSGALRGAKRPPTKPEVSLVDKCVRLKRLPGPVVRAVRTSARWTCLKSRSLCTATEPRRQAFTHRLRLATVMFGRKYLSYKRRGRDSNPRWGKPHTGFRDRPIRPLWHLSEHSNR